MSTYYNVRFLGSSDYPASAFQVTGIIHTCHQDWLILCMCFSRDGVSLHWQGWSQTPGLKWYAHLSLPKCWDYSCEPLCPAIYYLFMLIVVSLRFYSVGEAGLKLLASNDMPTSASQSVGITGVSHCVQLYTVFSC